MNAPAVLRRLAIPDAHASDPARLGWMQGSPPPADRLIRFADGSAYQFPQIRWSFCNFRQLVPTRQVARGSGPVSDLPRAERDDIDGLRFTPLGGGAPMRWAEALAANYTDGIVVLHHGRIVHERYFGALDADRPHIAMSLTKSVVGLLGATLLAEGRLHPDETVAHQVPEMAASGLGDATLRQLLDMSTGLQFSEDYADPDAEIWAHVLAGQVLPRPPGYAGPGSFCQAMPRVRKQGEHGQRFAYCTINTDALAWVMRRATGLDLAGLVAQRLWTRLGAEHDACLSIDAEGTEFAGGGLNTTLRDLARLGEMVRRNGFLNGQQIVPRGVVDDIKRGGDPKLFNRSNPPPQRGWTYRNMWWVTHNPHGALMARGVHGQALYVDPAAGMVVARYASHPMAANTANDPTTLPAWHALAQHLMAQPR